MGRKPTGNPPGRPKSETKTVEPIPQGDGSTSFGEPSSSVGDDEILKQALSGDIDGKVDQAPAPTDNKGGAVLCLFAIKLTRSRLGVTDPIPDEAEKQFIEAYVEVSKKYNFDLVDRFGPEIALFYAVAMIAQDTLSKMPKREEKEPIPIEPDIQPSGPVGDTPFPQDESVRQS